MKLNPSNIGIIKRLLVGRNNRPLRSILTKLESPDLAGLFGILNRRETQLLADALISINKIVPSLLEVPEQQIPEIFSRLDKTTIVHVLTSSRPDDAAYFLSLLSEPLRDSYLKEMPAQQQNRIQLFLDYPEDSAGRLMITDVFCLSTKLTASEGIEQLRKKAQEQSIYYIYCVDPENRLNGIISLRELATAPADKTLDQISKKEVVSVYPETSSEEVAKTVAHYDFIAIPVVDLNQKLLGIITVDDVLDIIQEQATANIYAQAGLQEDDRVYTPALTSIKKRLPWMGINLLLAVVASSVVSLFEDTMHELIILASLKNIVAGMGGNTAIQSLTVVTRGLATGDFNFISKSRAITKEMISGICIGFMTGIGAGALTYVWKGDLMVSIIIAISMILNSVIAASSGAVVPIVLKHFGRDPATGSGVIVTMITDIFSFFSFLGIATLALKFFT